MVFERLINGLAQLERNTRDLQESVMSIRMMPISVVFSRFPRVVRDLSQKLGEAGRAQTISETTEMDKSLVERITDPPHPPVRNSLDHGLETPERRRAAGKPETGTITLSAYHQSGNIVIEVGDDGAGLNCARILAKAKERGMAVSDAMSDQEVWQLIMEPGFSTASRSPRCPAGRRHGRGQEEHLGDGRPHRARVDDRRRHPHHRAPAVDPGDLDGMSVGVGPDLHHSAGLRDGVDAARARHDEEHLGGRAPDPGARRISAGDLPARGVPHQRCDHRLVEGDHGVPRPMARARRSSSTS